jgi:hypothetical protein
MHGPSLVLGSLKKRFSSRGFWPSVLLANRLLVDTNWCVQWRFCRHVRKELSCDRCEANNDNVRKMNSGHILLLLSAAFFVFASYAILFSAWLPLTGIVVSASLPRFSTDLTTITDHRLPRQGHSLQVLRHPDHTHNRILCHRKLGGLAVLPKFLKAGTSKTNIRIWHTTWII